MLVRLQRINSLSISWKLTVHMTTRSGYTKYQANRNTWQFTGNVKSINYANICMTLKLLSVSINFPANENWGNSNALNLSCNVRTHTAGCHEMVQVQGYKHTFSRWCAQCSHSEYVYYNELLNHFTGCYSAVLLLFSAFSFFLSLRCVLAEHTDLWHELVWLLFSASLVLLCDNNHTIDVGFLIRKKLALIRTHTHSLSRAESLLYQQYKTTSHQYNRAQ